MVIPATLLTTKKEERREKPSALRRRPTLYWTEAAEQLRYATSSKSLALAQPANE